MAEIAEDFLAHYGVPGMKWGRRKGSSRTAGDAKAVAPLRKKKPSQMTNDELRKLNERMQLEQNYKKLNPNVAVRGKKYVAATIGTIGLGVTLYSQLHSPAAQAAAKVAKEAMNFAAAASATQAPRYGGTYTVQRKAIGQ